MKLSILLENTVIHALLGFMTSFAFPIDVLFFALVWFQIIHSLVHLIAFYIVWVTHPELAVQNFDSLFQGTMLSTIFLNIGFIIGIFMRKQFNLNLPSLFRNSLLLLVIGFFGADIFISYQNFKEHLSSEAAR